MDERASERASSRGRAAAGGPQIKRLDAVVATQRGRRRIAPRRAYCIALICVSRPLVSGGLWSSWSSRGRPPRPTSPARRRRRMQLARPPHSRPSTGARSSAPGLPPTARGRPGGRPWHSARSHGHGHRGSDPARPSMTMTAAVVVAVPLLCEPKGDVQARQADGR